MSYAQFSGAAKLENRQRKLFTPEQARFEAKPNFECTKFTYYRN
jgi:hypothetical protein